MRADELDRLKHRFLCARVEPSTAAAQPLDSRQSALEIDITEVANVELAGLLMLSRQLGKSKFGGYLEGLLDHDL
jgi:hypothetical protein